ncbi:hypothetical protein AB0425_32360 [Actinosynnema sp. NPDC051121]
MRETSENLSSHARKGWSDVADMLRAAVTDTRSLRHVGHYTDGVTDLSVDVVDDAQPRGPESIRHDYSRIARQLNLSLSDLESELAEAGTGNLRRVVLNGRSAAVYCDAVLPNQHLIGFAETVPHDQEASTATPALMATLVGRLRERSGSALAEVGDGTGFTGLPHPWALPTGEKRAIRETGHADPLAARSCRAAVHPGGLHCLAWCTPDGVFTADCLNDPEVSESARHSGASAELRAFSTALGTQFPRLVGHLSRVGMNALGGRLEHVTVHFERGAIHCRRVRPGHLVIGVILDGDAVDRVADLVARLATRLVHRA